MKPRAGLGSQPELPGCFGCFGVAWLLALALALSLIPGCGASPVAVGATSVSTASTLLRPIMDTTREVRRTELDACLSLPTPDETDDCIDLGEAKWSQPVDALNATRDTLDAFLTALEAAHAHATDAPTTAQLVALARAVASAWGATASVLVAARADLRLPALPAEVRAFLGEPR